MEETKYNTGNFETKANLDNLHFNPTKLCSNFYGKQLQWRAIQCSRVSVNLFLMVDEDNLELFVYCKNLGDQQHPWLYQLGRLSEDLSEALRQLFVVEARVLQLFAFHKSNDGAFAYFNTIKTADQVKSLIPMP